MAGTSNCTYRLREPFTYEDKTYSELILDFDKLTGNDALAIETEMQQKGSGLIQNEAWDGGYQMTVASKASGIPEDVLLAMPLRANVGLRRKVRQYLTGGVSEIANGLGEKLNGLTGDTLQIIDNELRAERHTFSGDMALDTQYCLKLAARAGDMTEQQILNLPMNEFLNVKMAVRYFLLLADWEA